MRHRPPPRRDARRAYGGRGIAIRGEPCRPSRPSGRRPVRAGDAADQAVETAAGPWTRSPVEPAIRRVDGVRCARRATPTPGGTSSHRRAGAGQSDGIGPGGMRTATTRRHVPVPAPRTCAGGRHRRWRSARLRRGARCRGGTEHHPAGHDADGLHDVGPVRVAGVAGPECTGPDLDRGGSERASAQARRPLLRRGGALPLTSLTAREGLFQHPRLCDGALEKTGKLLDTAAAGGVGAVVAQLARALVSLTVIGVPCRVIPRPGGPDADTSAGGRSPQCTGSRPPSPPAAVGRRSTVGGNRRSPKATSPSGGRNARRPGLPCLPN